MTPNHILCLYVSYYLSRFNEEAYENLGFGNMNETHVRIGEILETNPHTVKNMRDQFDPLHGHRVGWYQAPLSPSRASIVEALQYQTEEEIRLIVKDILTNNLQKENKEKLLLIISDDNNNETKNFILRGPTGKAAEEFFIKYFTETQNPVVGKLIDCRDFGVGYDFKIETLEKNCFVEVKGLSDFSGGILFTSKEWIVAKNEGDSYFLCVISNLNEQPNIHFIQNPFAKLNPKKNIYTSIQISWSVTQNQLSKIK